MGLRPFDTEKHESFPKHFPNECSMLNPEIFLDTVLKFKSAPRAFSIEVPILETFQTKTAKFGSIEGLSRNTLIFKTLNVLI